MPVCKRCGNVTVEADRFCPKCGSPVESTEQATANPLPGGSSSQTEPRPPEPDGTRHARKRHRGAIVATTIIVVIVACVLVVGFAYTRGHRSSVPTAERTRIQTLLSPYAFVPARLPKGFVYVDWKHTSLDPVLAGQLLTVDFGAHGGQIVWTSSRACDSSGHIGPNATGWPGYAYGLTVDRSSIVAGTRVYFSEGNQGSNAWAYLPLKTSWGPDWVAVGIWESNCITPDQAMQLVASAAKA